MKEKSIEKQIIGYVCISIIFLLLLTSITIVGAGHRGVVFNRFSGVKDIPFDEGWHFKLPIIESVYKFEVRTMKEEVKASAASKDLQIVNSVIALQYHLRPDGTPMLFREIGRDYKERIIFPTIQESVKAITAEYTAEELITKRPIVREAIKAMLRERLRDYYIEVDDFNIVNFDFSEVFNKEIESKVTATQRKLKAERDLERIIIEKEQKITQAEAEARSLELQSKHITSDLIELRKIEVQSKAIDAQILAIEKWDSHLPKVTGEVIPFLSVAIELEDKEEKTE